MTHRTPTTVAPDLLRLCGAGGPVCQTPPPGIRLYRRSAPSGLESHLYDPVLCVVLQGAKTMRSGDIEVTVGAGDALVVSHHLPVLSRITQATAEAPYLAIVLTLDTVLIRTLLAQLEDVAGGPPDPGAISSNPLDPAWLHPLHRYLALADDPTACAVIGPGVLQEVYFRLLRTPTGAQLRSLAFKDSHTNRIASTISQIRAEVAAPLNMAQLAGSVGMSVSSFHAHFKAATGTTPLQYQKDLRLITARDLLQRGSHSVATAAFDVGYQSPTHFSRDFKRKFGHSPSDSAQYAEAG